MELINQIIARMKAEGATSATQDEIERCLSGCVSSGMLIAYAFAHCDEIEEYFDNEDRERDWEITEELKLENKDITF